MKDTGVIRRLDELGRITIPMELRKNLHLEERDPIHIFVDDEKIILQKYIASDIFTGESEDLVEYRGKKVSKQTILDLAKIAGLNITE